MSETALSHGPDRIVVLEPVTEFGLVGPRANGVEQEDDLRMPRVEHDLASVPQVGSVDLAAKRPAEYGRSGLILCRLVGRL